MLYELKEDQIVPGGSPAKTCFDAGGAMAALTAVADRRRTPRSIDRKPTATTLLMKSAGPRFVSRGPAFSSSIALRSKFD